LDAGLFWRRAGLPILTARDAIADFAAGRRALPLLPVLFDFNAFDPTKTQPTNEIEGYTFPEGGETSHKSD
jgi:hypothetical protein